LYVDKERSFCGGHSLTLASKRGDELWHFCLTRLLPRTIKKYGI